MQDKTRQTIEFLIEDNKKAIKNQKPKIALSKNPNLLEEDSSRNKSAIKEYLTLLRQYHSELFYFVKNMKGYVKDITETTHVCANYLLLCHVFDNWNSFFLLTEHGRNSAAQNLLRMIKEGLMTVELFVTEYMSGEDINLKKWYSGDIINHSTGNKKVSAFFDKYLTPLRVNQNLNELKTHIYQVESQSSHNGYATILEQISPFTEDFDFSDRTRLFRTKMLLRYATGSMTTTNITLKFIYPTLINDLELANKLNNILIKYNPAMGRGTN